MGHSQQPGGNHGWGYKQPRNGAGLVESPRVEEESSWANLEPHWVLGVVALCHERAPEESGRAEGSKGQKVESGR